MIKLKVEYLDNWEKVGKKIADYHESKYELRDGEAFHHPFLHCGFNLVFKKGEDEPIGYYYGATNEVRDFPWFLSSTEGNSGYDLRAAIPADKPIVIKPNCRALIPNGFKISFGDSFSNEVEFQVRARSGLAYKKGIMVVNGVGTVDYNYRGEVGTILYNSGTEDFVVNRGDRISQGVICPIYKPIIEVVESVDETDRGTNGYGSSGVK